MACAQGITGWAGSAFPAPQIPAAGWEKLPGTAAQGRERVLGTKDTPRAGMERCWMQPEDISCFQAYNSWCWLMEKQDLSREGEGTAWGRTEPLGGSSLATKSCPALSITISSALPHPQFPAPGSSRGVRVHPSITARSKCPIICWAVPRVSVKQVAELCSCLV